MERRLAMLPVYGNFLGFTSRICEKATATGIISHRYGSVEDPKVFIDNYASGYKSLAFKDRDRCSHNGMSIWFYRENDSDFGKLMICEDYWP